MDAVARAREHDEPLPRERAAGALTVSPRALRAASASARPAPAAAVRRARARRSPAGSRALSRSAATWPLQQRHARERDRQQDHEREQVDQRLREDGPGDDRQQAARAALQAAREHEHARAARRSRPGTSAEAITPIIVARTTGAQRHRRVGQRRAQRLLPGDRAHHQRQRPSARAPARSSPGRR